jgi:hypothetical protein
MHTSESLVDFGSVCGERGTLISVNVKGKGKGHLLLLFSYNLRNS